MEGLTGLAPEDFNVPEVLRLPDYLPAIARLKSDVR